MIEIMIFILLFFPLFVLAASIDIPVENRTIIQTDFPHKSTWTPTKEQTQKALTKILKFIDNPVSINDWQKKEILKIKKNISSFQVQFVGIEVEGEKRIWCNFFSDEGFDSWKDQIVMVFDGGFWFWQIEYVVKTDSCINFSSNGYA